MARKKDYKSSITNKSTQSLPASSRLFSKDYVGLNGQPIEQFILSIIDGAKNLLSDFDYESIDGVVISLPPSASGGGGTGGGGTGGGGGGGATTNIPPSISIPPAKPITVPGITQGTEREEIVKLIPGTETFDKLTESEILQVKNYYNYSVQYLNIFMKLMNNYKSISNYVDYFNSFVLSYDKYGNAKLSFQLDVGDEVAPLVTQNDGTISFGKEKIL